jgi:hypothetical protein
MKSWPDIWKYLFVVPAILQFGSNAFSDQDLKTNAAASGNLEGSASGLTAAAGKEVTKCHKYQRKTTAQTGTQLHSVEIMQENHKKADHSGEQAEGARSARPFDEETPIGDAWLDEERTIHVRLRRTADGINVSGSIQYPVGDKNYEKIMKHLGGLKQGEVKLVAPWKDEEQDEEQ